MTIFSRLFGSGARGARAEALRRGAVVEDVKRDVPIFSRGNRLEGFQPASCVRYSLQRRPGSLPSHWSFLQRGERLGAPFPHGWGLQTVGEEVPDQLRRELAQVAAEWTEELLEFEADETRVSAYWEEWGGTKRASVVVGYLERLAQV